MSFGLGLAAGAAVLVPVVAPFLVAPGVGDVPGDALPAGAEAALEGALLAGVFGAAGCVAADTVVVAQRKAHASAQANEVVRLICARIVTLAPHFGHGGPHEPSKWPQAGLPWVNSTIIRLSHQAAALKFNSDTLLTHLEKQLLPVYLISGDEPLLTAEATDAVRAKARASGFTERETHFMERGGDWNDVRASANNLSLFAERRIVEIRMPTGKPGNTGSAAIVALLGNNDPDRVLLLTAPKLDRDAQGSEWVRAVETHGALVQVWPVEASRLAAWLRSRAKRLKLNVEDDALELIADRTEGNLLAADQELQKLRMLARGDRVSLEDVLGSVADSARFDVFQLGECALAGDTARALRMLEVLRAEGVEPTLVLWSLSKTVRDLWGSVHSAGGGRPTWRRQTAALEQGERRAPKLHFGRLTARATRADRMIKGRESGDAWDEMALLAMDICARPIMPLPRSVVK